MEPSTFTSGLDTYVPKNYKVTSKFIAVTQVHSEKWHISILSSTFLLLLQTTAGGTTNKAYNIIIAEPF